MEIYLIRHTKINAPQAVCYGQSDVSLCESFEEEGMELVSKLPTTIDAVYTSPMERCRKLADVLNHDNVISDERLLELNFGSWEMKPWDEINQEELMNWMNDFVHVKTPDGESYLDLHSRIKSLIDEILPKPYERVAIISHAGAIRTIISYLLNTPLESAFNFEIENGKVSLIKLDGQIKRIEYLNR